MTGGEVFMLEDVSTDTWESFHAGRGASASGVLLSCWSRARELGAPPFGAPPEEHLLRGEALRLHAEPVDMLRSLGETVLERAAGKASASQHVLLLADADGVVVKALGGGDFADTAQRVRLIEGACWSEAVRGTNAIGTAAELNRPTVVRGRAHFAYPYHGLVCCASPVRGIDGRPLAVLDATSNVQLADPSIIDVVVEAAAALEEIIRLRAYASVGASVRGVLLRSLDRLTTAAWLVETPGRVIRANRLGHALLSRDSAATDVAAALGLSFDDLVRDAHSPAPGGRVVEVGRRHFRLRADPIESSEGTLLAVLVQLEPLARSVAHRSEANAAPDPFASIFAEDGELVKTIRWARQLSQSELPVVLLAETGAGKELFAQAIHAASARAAGPFVAVNCGSVAPSLLESELFGYAPGAFTGAHRSGRSGLLEAASGGTLFLDEVAEMAPAMQASLLRVLETGAFRRIGDVRSGRVDIRLVCATCRDLPALVASGEFRQDLYYRLKGATLRLPPLRERTDKIALARHLLSMRNDEASAAELDPATESILAAYDWPGNVRELKSVLEVALVAAQGVAVLLPCHLPSEILAGPASHPADGNLLALGEAQTARRVLAESGGNISLAARKLGVARSTLYRMARRYGLL